MSVCRNYECIEWQKKRTVFVFNVYTFFLFDVVVAVAVNVNIIVVVVRLSCSISFMACLCHWMWSSLSVFALNLHSAGGNYCLDVMFILLLVILSLLFCITRDAINSVCCYFLFLLLLFVFRFNSQCCSVCELALSLSLCLAYSRNVYMCIS